MRQIFLILVLMFGIQLNVQAAAEKKLTKITWYGHAAFSITTPNGKVFFVDPWLRNPSNPAAKLNGKEKPNYPVGEVNKVDYILVTHGHFDHTGDAVVLGKTTGAKLVANFELGTNMRRLLGYPADANAFATLMNSGGEISVADGEVQIVMTPAVHSSGLDVATPQHPNLPLAYGGNANGFVIKIQDGPTIYHTGDTAYFNDMAEIKAHRPDVALVNIGGHFGMEALDAARCAKAVGAKWVVPHHYKTFPILTQDPVPFLKAVKRNGAEGLLMEPGQSLTFNGKRFVK